MIAFRFLKSAQTEMREATKFYDQQAVGLGIDFINDVEHTIERIRRHPLSGVEKDSNIRFSLLLRFPFSIIYSVDLVTIVIIAVGHQRRLPGYWQQRIKS